MKLINARDLHEQISAALVSAETELSFYKDRKIEKAKKIAIAKLYYAIEEMKDHLTYYTFVRGLSDEDEIQLEKLCIELGYIYKFQSKDWDGTIGLITLP